MWARQVTSISIWASRCDIECVLKLAALVAALRWSHGSHRLLERAGTGSEEPGVLNHCKTKVLNRSTEVSFYFFPFW